MNITPDFDYHIDQSFPDSLEPITNLLMFLYRVKPIYFAIIYAMERLEDCLPEYPDLTFKHSS
jgi:hypothetical protein